MGGGCDLLFIFVTFLVSVSAVTSKDNQSGTKVGFYANSCPGAVSIVRMTVLQHYTTNRTIAPGILRMHFHDCFVHGCDGSILLAGSTSERTAVPNRPLRGFEVIDDAKEKLEVICPGVVSCADILALAARDVVVLTGGVSWEVPLGRRDGRISQASDVNLPGPTDPISKQKLDFANKNLDTKDLVTLVGAHTLGTTSCGLVRGTFFNFSGTGKPDPLIKPRFVKAVQARCPLNGNPTTRIRLDSSSPENFDTFSLENVESNTVLLPSDLELWKDTETRTIIEQLLHLRRPFLNFRKEFGNSMIKMSLIDVKTGSNGEIRKVCSAVN